MDTRCTRRQLLGTAAKLAAAMAMGSAMTAAIAQAAGTSRPIPRRVLGKTGVEVAILGLGADGMVTDSPSGDAVAAFVADALDAGVNFLDTAHMYGKDGSSEKNLGLVMGTRRRASAFLATKTGNRTYDGAMKQVEESLKRLRTDHLDLIQVHHVNDKDDVKALGAKTGVIAALRKLQSEKVVRFVGMTGHSSNPAVEEALRLYEWDTFMCFVNPARFSEPALSRQLPAATKKGTGIIGMKVFGGRPGLLAGNGPGQADAVSLLRFAWSQPIAVALTGVSSRQQFQENLEAARAFSPMTAAEIAAIGRRINSGPKPWEHA